ncbi:glycosyltransferase family 2 protein [Aeromonas media]|uniref:glycosyltransferase family 2 protein n=1 Tax=Aeromonas media TaxID=651 RepID=UPI003D26084B
MALIKKSYTYMLSLIKYMYYSSVRLKKDKNYLNSNSKYVISLTTYGERADILHLVIKTLLLQSHKPKKIFIWLSHDDFPNGKVPPKLKELESFGIDILLVDENIRSYKKIYYTYLKCAGNKNPCYIVTADDDVYYPSNWLEGFDGMAMERKDSILCYRAQKILFSSRGVIKSYREWELSSGNAASWDILPTGVSGICYPISSLHGLECRDFLNICPTTDDIWLKFITMKNGYKSCLVGQTSIHFTPVFKPFTLPQKGLEVENVYNDANTAAFNNCLDYFNFKKDDFI